MHILFKNIFYKIPYDYKNHIQYKLKQFCPNHYIFHNMHENIQPPHSKQAFLNVPTVPRPKQERHCIWWLHHFLFKRNIYPLLQLYHYRKHILYSQNHHIRNTFLGISLFFLFYRRHIIFHIKTFFCFCFPHASLSPATSSVFAPNLQINPNLHILLL